MKKTISNAYKPTDLGLIPTDWVVKAIKELGKVKGGKRLPKGQQLVGYDTGYPYIKAGDLKNGTVLSDQIEFIDESIYKKIKRYTVKTGDIYITIVGANIGDVGLIPAEMNGANLTENAAKIFDLSDVEIERQFIVYFLDSHYGRMQIKNLIGSGAQPKLGLNKIEILKIPVPKLSEQKSIVDLLSVWTRAINLTKRLIAEKEQRKKWLMQQLLIGKKRLKGFKGEWKEYHLGDFFDERNETNYVNLPLLSIGQSGVYPQSDSDKKDNSNEDKSKYRRICKGDIGYNTMRMWQGRSALSQLEGIVSPAYTILTPKKNADSLFFSYLFKLPKMVNSFFRNSQGLVEDTLNCKYKDFAIVKAHLPQKEEQIAIAKIIRETERELSKLSKKVDLLKEQKKGLMQILLTGKKRLKYK